MDAGQSSLHELIRQVMGRLMLASMTASWRFAKARGLSMTQMMILRQIHASLADGCNVSLISDRMGLTNAAISQTLDRLVEQGLVSRTEDPQDRRSKCLLLTPDGERLLAETMEAQQAWVAALLAGLDSQEQALLRRSFELIAARLDEPAQPAASARASRRNPLPPGDSP